MIMKKVILFLSLFLQISILHTSVHSEPFMLGQEPEKQVFVNNRILAKVNGKPISVIDVMKKMDVHFYRQYPQYASSPVARFQFYQISWKQVLNELIDKELLLADAEEHHLTVTSGDIRQEMEDLFGPNIIANLDKINLSFEDAWKIVQEDSIIKRMLYVRAHSKGTRKIIPQDVRKAYEEFAKENTRPDEWHYIVISIRDPDSAQGAEVANFAYQLLLDQKVPFNDIPKHATSFANWKSTTKVSVSEEFKHTAKDLSPTYKEVLDKMPPNSFCRPISQKSRKDNASVFRIFYLKEMVPGGVVPFSEVEAKLKDQLVDQAIAEETEAYLKKLRLHHNVQEGLLLDLEADNFQPFVLK
jgi:hypothetical protein